MPASKTNWDKLRAKTDEDIAHDVAGDADADLSEFDVTGEYGEGRLIPIIVDPNVASWLADHHLDGGKIASALLALFVAAQTKEN